MLDTTLPEPADVAETRPATPVASEPRPFLKWYWALVPALAIAAYATVLRIGFLSDDYLFLYRTKLQGFSFSLLLPSPDFSFYRPFSNLLTWEVGWYLFGSNPLPYHIVSLVLHAITSLVLGLWLAEATQRQAMGWLAGALFAVLPLHTEAVGWLAAQWDIWATMFGMLGLWLFTRWLRHRTKDEGRKTKEINYVRPSSFVLRPAVLYLLSLLCYGLGVFSKESMLTFLPVFALSAWFVTPRFGRREMGRLVLALLPFGAIVALNVVLRLVFLGSLGGYTNLRSGYLDLMWSGLATALRMLVSPINAVELGTATEITVAAIVGILLLVGLVFYGRSTLRLLVVVAGWLVFALLPVLDLFGIYEDLGQSRLLYLPAAGYCAGVAALFYAAYQKARGRALAALRVGAVAAVIAAVGFTWLNLRPWHTATVMAADIDAELARLIPLQPHPEGMIWYIQDRPDNYQGAFIYRLGLGVSRTFSGGVVPWTEDTLDAASANLAADHRDSYAIRFAYDSSAPAYHVAYVTGETPGVEPSALGQPGENPTIWDFRTCSADAVKAWHPQSAHVDCQPGVGLHVTSTSGDPQLIGPEMSLDPKGIGARWVRISAAVVYPAVKKPDPYLAQFFWRQPDDSWSEHASSKLNARQDGKSHIYWALLSVNSIGPVLGGLRFDPINGTAPTDISWIAVELLH